MVADKSRSLLLFRLLALAHGTVGLGPLFFSLIAGGLLAGGSWLLPSGGAGLLWLLVVALQLVLPIAWAAWMLYLASRLWRPTPSLANLLRWTHAVVLLLGGLHLVFGFYAVRAAEKSAAAGGGLLSPVAYFPILVGAALVLLAGVSLVAAGQIRKQL